MVYFQTKNPKLGKFWRVLQWKMLVYFMAIWYILWSFCIFHGTLVYFVVILYISYHFGIFCGHLVYFLRFWFIVPLKIWQPCSVRPFPLNFGYRAAG
jgi:hypothetical protein